MPKLTIDRDEWKTAKNMEKSMMKDKEVEVELDEVGDDWWTEAEAEMSGGLKDQERAKAKRKQTEEDCEQKSGK